MILVNMAYEPRHAVIKSNDWIETSDGYMNMLQMNDIEDDTECIIECDDKSYWFGDIHSGIPSRGVVYLYSYGKPTEDIAVKITIIKR